MKLIEQHIRSFNLPEEAIAWLSGLWDVIQGMDDWVDGDEVSKRDKELVIYKALVLLPSNTFYINYAQYLAPVVSNMVLKWVGANHLEDLGKISPRSFMWRAAYYDLILEVIRVVHGVEKAMEVASYVASMYGEDYNDYLKEFEHA